MKSHTRAPLCVLQAALLTSVELITPCSCKDLCKSLQNQSVTSISTLYALLLQSYSFAVVDYIEPHCFGSQTACLFGFFSFVRIIRSSH